MLRLKMRFGRSWVTLELILYIYKIIYIKSYIYMHMHYRNGLPACQCRGHVFDPWVRKIPWRRKWQPSQVFLPWKSHEHRSLGGYSPWGCRVGHDLVTEYTCILQRYMTNSEAARRSAVQTQCIPSDERWEPTNKNTLPSKTLIKIWWRNQMLSWQANN